MNLQEYKKIIVILGPTASGKSDLAIALAKKYGGEIVSADSRQVYRGMDIGTGKVTRDCVSGHPERVKQVEGSYFFSEGIRHHLLDVASPKRSYNVTHFVRDAKKAITNIQKRGKIPIICGGTGFWVQALIEGTTFPPVKPDLKLRKKLSQFSAEKLFSMLKKKDGARAASIDPKNKIRLIRALEICNTLGHVPPKKEILDSRLRGNNNLITIALNPEKEILKKNIKVRLEKRLQQGMIAEVKRLRNEGVSWKRLESFGLEYKNIALFLQKKISRQTMYDNILREIFQYAKRQLTWLRRWEKMGAHIHWTTNPKDTKKIVKAFLISA